VEEILRTNNPQARAVVSIFEDLWKLEGQSSDSRTLAASDTVRPLITALLSHLKGIDEPKDITSGLEAVDRLLARLSQLEAEIPRPLIPPDRPRGLLDSVRTALLGSLLSTATVAFDQGIKTFPDNRYDELVGFVIKVVAAARSNPVTVLVEGGSRGSRFRGRAAETGLRRAQSVITALRSMLDERLNKAGLPADRVRIGEPLSRGSGPSQTRGMEPGREEQRSVVVWMSE
jgi:hypothetical protein